MTQPIDIAFCSIFKNLNTFHVFLVLHNRHFRKKNDESYTMQGLKLDYMGCAKISFIPQIKRPFS